MFQVHEDGGLWSLGEVDLLLTPDSGIAGIAVSDSPRSLNDSLEEMEEERVTSYNPGDDRGDAGVFTVQATFMSKATNDMSFEALCTMVARISEHARLLNVHLGNGGQGSKVFDPADLGDDGMLSPGESFVVLFEIALDEARPFEFFINFMGHEDS